MGLRAGRYILAAVLILACFQKSPTAVRLQAMKLVYRYLCGTTRPGLKNERMTLHGESFMDADYSGDSVDQKSVSGFLVKLHNPSIIRGARNGIK